MELLGWLGLLLFTGTLIPLFNRCWRFSRSAATIFTRYHHALALSSLVVLTIHGALALTGKYGWQWTRLLHLRGDAFTGAVSWLALLAVVLTAVLVDRRKLLFARNHCWLVVILVVAVLLHIS